MKNWSYYIVNCQSLFRVEQDTREVQFFCDLSRTWKTSTEWTAKEVIQQGNVLSANIIEGLRKV